MAAAENSGVYYSNLSTESEEGSSTKQPKDLNELHMTELDGEDDGMSDEDNDGMYAVIIDDTLSVDSSSPEQRSDNVKPEVVTSRGDAIPYQVNQPFSTEECAGGGMCSYGDRSYNTLPCLSPTSTHHDVQHIAIASKTSSFENMHKRIKQEPSECSGQFTYSMSSLQLESQLVDKAIDNLMTLPQVFTEVVESKKSQSAEIELQQLNLVTLQKEYEEGEKDIKALRDDVSIVTHNISCTMKSVIEGTKQCNTLQQEVASYVLICKDIHQAVRYKQEEYDLQKRKIESYQMKIADYIRTVAQQENQSDTMIELRNHVDDVQRLHEKKAEIELNKEEFMNLMNGTSDSRVTDNITYLTGEMEGQATGVEDKAKLIDDLRNQQRLLEQSILVLHKRNAAQLTRLRRQLKEVSSRRRRWNDQVSQLENIMTDLKQQLQQ
ncbi:uncharacterized protein LOC110453984 isoform X2 [Mizuhopecten yessoensis]|nr:uncharacterized protein LOC110453984 isoform X2 [Mizuhopecten yessoensis]